MIDEMRKAWVWIAANLAGAVLFLWLCSKVWIEPELRGEDVARGGDGLVFFYTALPVLLLFIGINTVVFAFIVARIARTASGRAAWPVLPVGTLWIGALGINYVMA